MNIESELDEFKFTGDELMEKIDHELWRQLKLNQLYEQAENRLRSQLREQLWQQLVIQLSEDNIKGT